jgi:hypothetical protein
MILLVFALLFSLNYERASAKSRTTSIHCKAEDNVIVNDEHGLATAKLTTNIRDAEIVFNFTKHEVYIRGETFSFIENNDNLVKWYPNYGAEGTAFFSRTKLYGTESFLSGKLSHLIHYSNCKMVKLKF